MLLLIDVDVLRGSRVCQGLSEQCLNRLGLLLDLFTDVLNVCVNSLFNAHINLVIQAVNTDTRGLFSPGRRAVVVTS